MILGAPTEPVMGLVQKIFYFHVPCAIMMFLSTFVCAGGSIAFLFKGRSAAIGWRLRPPSWACCSASAC